MPKHPMQSRQLIHRRRSSVVNSNSINPRNNQCRIKTYTDNSLNQCTNETHGSAGFVDWTYDGEGRLLTLERGRVN